MLKVIWTRHALQDLGRLYEFLAAVNEPAAKTVLAQLKTAPRRLQEQPGMGSPLPEFSSREVRRLNVGRYELRYEVRPEAVYILRLWHTREDR